MSRYKGRTGPKSIERNFPHIVETIAPAGRIRQEAGCDARIPDQMESGLSIQPDDATRMAAITSGGALLIGKIVAMFAAEFGAKVLDSA
jgi:hypothetical protein